MTIATFSGFAVGVVFLVLLVPPTTADDGPSPANHSSHCSDANIMHVPWVVDPPTPFFSQYGCVRIYQDSDGAICHEERIYGNVGPTDYDTDPAASCVYGTIDIPPDWP